MFSKKTQRQKNCSILLEDNNFIILKGGYLMATNPFSTPRLTTDKYKSFFNFVKKDLNEPNSNFGNSFAIFDEEIKNVLDKITKNPTEITEKEWEDFLIIAEAKDSNVIPYQILTVEPSPPDNILLSALMTDPGDSSFLDVLNIPRSQDFLDACIKQSSFVVSLWITLDNAALLNNTNVWQKSNKCKLLIICNGCTC